MRYTYGGDYLYTTLIWPDLVWVPAMMIVLTALAALSPALMAARMRPSEALRRI